MVHNCLGAVWPRLQAQRLRDKAAEAQVVADITTTSERASVDLQKRAGGPAATGAALGALLNKKGSTAPQLLTSWCSDGAGGVNKESFAANVIGLGLNAGRADTDTLFDMLDADGGGECCGGGEGGGAAASVVAAERSRFVRLRVSSTLMQASVCARVLVSVQARSMRRGCKGRC